jgi:WD40 repeat protein
MLDPDTGELVLEFDRVSGPTELATSPDGRWIAGGGPGPFAHLWDAEMGRLLRRLRGSIYAPTSVAFTDEGSQLWVMSIEGTMRGYALDPVDLLELARAETTRTLTNDECERYLHRSCDP